MNPTDDQLRETVRRKYAGIAESDRSCRSDSQCYADSPDSGTAYNMIGDAYQDVAGYMAEADLGLGCGVPVEHASLQSGQVVVDLGSGAGLDAFVARRMVGESGHVIGIDMTAAMLARARENATSQGFRNVEFRLGEIEHLPVRSNQVDVVISNCVLNLVPDKRRAFSEIYRVLKPGGHFCISDVVSSERPPTWLSGVAEAYAGCVAGALPKPEYLGIVTQTGFVNISTKAERRIHVPADLLDQFLTENQSKEISHKDLHVLSITLTASKPWR